MRFRAREASAIGMLRGRSYFRKRQKTNVFLLDVFGGKINPGHFKGAPALLVDASWRVRRAGFHAGLEWQDAPSQEDEA